MKELLCDFIDELKRIYYRTVYGVAKREGFEDPMTLLRVIREDESSGDIHMTIFGDCLVYTLVHNERTPDVKYSHVRLGETKDLSELFEDPLSPTKEELFIAETTLERFFIREWEIFTDNLQKGLVFKANLSGTRFIILPKRGSVS